MHIEMDRARGFHHPGGEYAMTEDRDRTDAVARQMMDMVGRRRLLGRGLAVGGAVAGATLLAAAPADAAAPDNAAAPDKRRHRTLIYDVAMIGESLKVIAGPDIDNFDLRGTTFYVEGPIYPGGTIPANRTDGDPAAHVDEEIGRWFDVGSFMLYQGRPNPHLYSTMTHVFG